MDVEPTRGNSIVKEVHRQRVLKCVRDNQPISRIAISERTGISKSTVSRIVDEMLSSGLIMETGCMDAASRRKPTGIRLNPSAYYCVGINITLHNLRVVIMDFSTEIVYQSKTAVSDEISGEALTGLVCAQLEGALRDSGVAQDKILGVGVGVAGIIDNVSGVVVNFASTGRMTNVPLKARLEERFPYPFYIDNDTNTRALAEHAFGYAAGVNECLFIACREGLGSGIITNGMLLRGALNITGELGHTIINTLGRRCVCGKFGCLEAYCSARALVDGVRHSIAHGRKTSLSEKELTCEGVMRAFEEGDALCTEHVSSTADLLSTGVSNLIYILNPEMVILSGDMFDHSPKFCAAVEAYTLEKLFDPAAQRAVFRYRKSGDRVYRIGAASLVYQDFFS